MLSPNSVTPVPWRDTCNTHGALGTQSRTSHSTTQICHPGRKPACNCHTSASRTVPTNLPGLKSRHAHAFGLWIYSWLSMAEVSGQTAQPQMVSTGSLTEFANPRPKGRVSSCGEGVWGRRKEGTLPPAARRTGLSKGLSNLQHDSVLWEKGQTFKEGPAGQGHLVGHCDMSDPRKATPRMTFHLILRTALLRKSLTN